MCYKHAVALAPKMADAYVNLGIAYFELGQTDESLAAHGKALELQPESIIAKWNARLTLPALYDRLDREGVRPDPGQAITMPRRTGR